MKSISLCQVPSLYDTQSSSKWFSASRLDGFFISSFTSFTWIQLLKTWTFGELIWRTTKQGPHRCDILTGNRCHICPSVVSPSPPFLPPMSPPTPEGNVWSSDDTWHVPPLHSPPQSSDHPHSQVSSIISCRYLTSWTLSDSPPPLTDAWCLNSCQFGKFSIDERVAWVFTSNLIFNSCNFTAPHCSPLPAAPLLREMGWRTKNSRDKQNSHE